MIQSPRSPRSSPSYPKEIKVIFLSVALALLSYWTIFKAEIYGFDGGRKDESLIDRPVRVSADGALAVNVTAVKSKPRQRVATTTTPSDTTATSPVSNSALKFYIISIPETTSVLVESNRQTKEASAYYHRSLNEESAELWLHRGFELLPQRTLDPKEADVFVVVGYLHLYQGLRGHRKLQQLWKQFIPLYREKIVDPSKPHLLLIPSWNPKVSREVGIHALVNMLGGSQQQSGTIWSVGFERNPKWQNLPPSRIIPIPYVVNGEDSNSVITSNVTTSQQSRTSNSVFYAGDARKNAEAWAGCFRSRLVDAMKRQQLSSNLQQVTTTNASTKNHTTSNNHLINVQLLGKRDRIEQATYNAYMTGSDWCLVLCGDTPSSRTLTSTMIFGCIPIRVGSRLRGICEEPCHKGFGWEVTGTQYPHLPYADKIDWDQFPEINEAELLNSTKADILARLFARYRHEDKEKLRSIMRAVRRAWIYGWGDPVTSANESLGDAARFIWDAFVDALRKEQGKTKE